MLSANANGLMQILFTENIIPREQKDLFIVDEALVVIVMKFDEEKETYSIPVAFKWAST